MSHRLQCTEQNRQKHMIDDVLDRKLIAETKSVLEAR